KIPASPFCDFEWRRRPGTDNAPCSYGAIIQQFLKLIALQNQVRWEALADLLPGHRNQIEKTPCPCPFECIERPLLEDGMVVASDLHRRINIVIEDAAPRREERNP